MNKPSKQPFEHPFVVTIEPSNVENVHSSQHYFKALLPIQCISNVQGPEKSQDPFPKNHHYPH